MPTLSDIFDKRKILLYQNESLDLDHYYQEPYQDEDDEIKEMARKCRRDYKSTQGCFKVLNHIDMETIYQMAK